MDQSSKTLLTAEGNRFLAGSPPAVFFHPPKNWKNIIYFGMDINLEAFTDESIRELALKNLAGGRVSSRRNVDDSFNSSDLISRLTEWAAISDR